MGHAYRYYIKESAWLCSHKTSFTETGGRSFRAPGCSTDLALDVPVLGTVCSGRPGPWDPHLLSCTRCSEKWVPPKMLATVSQASDGFTPTSMKGAFDLHSCQHKTAKSRPSPPRAQSLPGQHSPAPAAAPSLFLPCSSLNQKRNINVTKPNYS